MGRHEVLSTRRRSRWCWCWVAVRAVCLVTVSISVRGVTSGAEDLRSGLELAFGRLIAARDPRKPKVAQSQQSERVLIGHYTHRYTW